MAVIDDELMLIGSANCNNRGWETDSELVVASFEDDQRARASAAGRLRVALWAHHLGVPASAVADPVRSRGLWDTASSRLVCRYDPGGGTALAGHRRTGSSIPPIAGRVIRASRCSGRRPPLEGRDGRSPPQASFGNARRAVYKTALDG